MAKSCPVSLRTIDNTVSRLNAMSIALLLILFLLSHSVALLGLVIYDFVIRLFGDKRFSFSQQLSLLLQKHYALKKEPIDAGAKRVAAFMGLFMAFLLLVLNYFDLDIGLYVVGGFFLLCAGMEFLVSFCLGCEVYYIFKKFF